jgi:hypothetical protein
MHIAQTHKRKNNRKYWTIPGAIGPTRRNPCCTPKASLRGERLLPLLSWPTPPPPNNQCGSNPNNLPHHMLVFPSLCLTGLPPQAYGPTPMIHKHRAYTTPMCTDQDCQYGSNTTYRPGAISPARRNPCCTPKDSPRGERLLPFLSWLNPPPITSVGLIPTENIHYMTAGYKLMILTCNRIYNIDLVQAKNGLAD